MINDEALGDLYRILENLGAAPATLDKPRSSCTLLKQPEGFETNSPWFRLLPESAQVNFIALFIFCECVYVWVEF